MTATLRVEPVDQVDFDHVLYILPPVLDRGQVMWFGYIDDPSKWRRVYDSVGNLAAGAAQVLEKMLRYERAKEPGLRDPNRSSGGPIPKAPNVPPLAAVRVTANCRELDPEWTIVTLDAASWGGTDLQLTELLRRLAVRIQAAKPAPMPLLSTVETTSRSVTSPPPTAEKVQANIGGFEDAVQEQIDRLATDIQRKHQVVEAARQDVEDLLMEQRRLKAALRAYQGLSRRPGPRTKVAS